MRRHFFHYLCIVVLLIAQQGALVHAAWHAGGGAHDTHAHDSDSHVHDHEHDGEAPAGQANLCALDLAFGQVLGGVHGFCILPNSVEQPAVSSAYVFNPRLGSEAVPAHSRGPPLFL